ncbi:MAG: type II secretion system protein [Meiothermus sp.]|nr:type II secretion system protein [Meiothermus sp.]
MKTRGFTLLEIIIAMAVMGILMVSFIQFFVGSLKTAQDIDNRSELVTEGQIAHQLISARLQEAWHLLPPGTSVALSHTAAWMITKPSGGTTWTVESATEPFMAMVLPPTNLGQTCSSTDTRGCYRFFAYYSITRSSYVSNTSNRANDRLISDPSNPGAWVLMQYRGFIPSGTVTSGSTSVTVTPASLWDIRADLLADYVVPVNSSLTFSNYQPFDMIGTAAPFRVVLDLRFSRSVQGRTIQLGGTSDSLRSEVLARNQGQLAP